MADSVLLIDDDVEVLRQLGQVFERAGGEVARELDLETGLAAFDRLRPEVVLLDFGLRAMAGDEFLVRFRERHAAIVLLIEEPELAPAIAAMQAGAEALLVKPVDPAHLQAVVARVAEKVRLQRLNEMLLLQSGPGEGLGTLGGSPAMQALVREAGQAAAADRTPVVLVGERGVGRSWLARIIHRMSPRARGVFVALGCRGAETGALLARLFGEDRVAPGGARERRPGLIEAGGGGTIYIRELADLPPEAQPLLLKLLENRAFRRVGGTRDLTADVRVMAGSSRPVPALLEAGLISDDLAYRLNVLSVTIPPVRSRSRDDRLALLSAVVERLQDEAPDAPGVFAPEAIERLVSHSWPGNVTEMIHVLGRALMLSQGQEAISLDHLPGELRNRAGPGDRRHTPMTLDALERAHIERTLRHHGGNRTKAAQELGISRATLINKIKRYSIER